MFCLISCLKSHLSIQSPVKTDTDTEMLFNSLSYITRMNWCMARQCSYASVLSGFSSVLRISPLRAVKDAASKPNEALFCVLQLQQRTFHS